MNSILHSLYSFFILLSGGTFLARPFVKARLTGMGFYKLIASVSLGSLLISFVLSFIYFKSHAILIGIILFALIQEFLRKNEEDSVATVFRYYSVNILFAFLLYKSYWGMAYFFFLFALFTLGLTNYLMLLGHYYLVVPKLTTAPLIRASQFLWLVLGIKILMACYGVYQAREYLTEGTVVGMGYLYNFIFVSMRVLWGYVALAVLSFFGYRCAKMNSTQSATGIFYIMVFFVLIGELLSLYLWHEMGVLI